MKDKISRAQAKGEKKKKKHGKRRIVLIILAVLILAIVGLCIAIVWQITGGGVDIVDPSDVDPTAKEVKIAKENPIDQDVYNVLLVGTDSRDPDSDMGRSDSMMLVSFNKNEGKSTIISFLRDTLVPTAAWGLRSIR